MRLRAVVAFERMNLFINRDRTSADGYRHFIDSLKRKPQAFKGLAFRDALFRREAYRQIWEQLESKLSPREAC